VPDDRFTRRARTQGDRDRRTPDPRGFPAYVEPETTPPPQEPPAADSVEGYSTISPPIRERMEQLAAGQAQVTAWLGKLSELRDGQWLSRIDDRLSSIAKSTTRHEAILDELRPQLDRWRATTDGLATQIPKLLSMVEGLTLHVRSIDDRMRSLELDVRALTERTREHAEAVEAAADRESVLLERLTRLEQIERDRETTAAAIAKVEHKKSRNAGAASGGAIGAVIAAVIAAVTR
jgi:chromosome segregation ATPase